MSQNSPEDLYDLLATASSDLDDALDEIAPESAPPGELALALKLVNQALEVLRPLITE